MRKIRVRKQGFGPCERCRLHAKLRTLDVKVAAIAKSKYAPAVPAGWCPLIALCGQCWADVVAMLRTAR